MHGPRRASLATAEAPPPETARVQPRTAPCCAPAWKPAQPATSEQSSGKGAAARDCTGAASHHTVVRASVEASAARDERAVRRPRRRRLRLHGCSLAPHPGARQRRSQRSPQRAS
eukprot:scaffold115332_cov68-Phaeocystis_antarctica.AAC.1